MTKLLGKDLQNLGGDLNVSSRVQESYPANADLDDNAANLFPSGISRWISVGASGDVVVMDRHGDTHTIYMLAGEMYPGEWVKVMKTNTAATKIVVWF